MRNFFFKPWGTRDDPVRKEDRQSFANLVEDLDFPKGKPSDVNVGDIVICFGTGSRCVVSVYQALSFPEERSKEEQERDPHAKRWPWLLHGQNYTPRFGGQWWEHDVSIDELVLEFVELYGDVPVTAAGGSSLGALQFGAGRLRLSKEFGVFVATKILELELSNSDDFKEEKAASDNESQGERAFHEEMINLYQRAFAEANYRARVFIQRVETDGGLTTAKSLINAAQVSDGYTELWDRGFLNLTVEAFVLENERFHPLFEADEIERCRSRLGAYGYFTDPRYRL